MKFKAFPDVEGFHNVVKTGEYYGFPTVNYRGKIKLHGTNAAVRIKDGVVAAQSRTKIITPTDDNAGFARWVESRKEWLLSCGANDNDVAIFGEWCGPGIMKGTAINQIPTKIFAVFAVVEFTDESDDDAIVTVEPDEITAMLTGWDIFKPDDVYVLPWASEKLLVQFGDREQLQGVADGLSKLVDELEPCDPWVKATFGVEGTAEGLVYYPLMENSTKIRRKFFSEFIFKAKGEKHKVIKTKQAVQVDPEVAANISEFVTLFVTEPRMEQGVENTGPVNMKNTGAFLKWVCEDVQKESKAELEASNLTWDQVSKAVQIAAREWYKAKATKIT